MLFAAPVLAQDAPKDPSAEQPVDPALHDAVTEQAMEIARQLINEYAGVEQEQKALLEKLGEADERVEAEKARADRLERELARLLGRPATPGPAPEPGTADDAAAEEASPRLPELAVPPRRVDALGMVQGGDANLADAPAGGDALQWTPLAGTLAPDGALRVVSEPAELRFEHHDAMGGSTLLATLMLRDGAVAWRWANLPSSSAQASLARLPWVLAGSTLEALAAGEVVMRWGFAPPTFRVPLRSGREMAPAPPFDPAVALVLEPAAGQAGWVLDARAPAMVRAMSPRAVLTVQWRPGEAVVVDSRVSDGILEHLDQQIAAWEGDVVELRRKDPPDAQAVARAEAVVAELRSKRMKLQAVASPPSPAPGNTPGSTPGSISGWRAGDGFGGRGMARSSYTVHLVGENGAVCGRYVIQP